MYRARCAALCVTIVLAVCASAYGQSAATYPAKPLRLIVPIAPGGGMDTAARVLASKMGETLGQSVIVDNRSGAGGAIGVQATIAAPADGYTLLVGTISTLVLIPATRAAPSYDALRDIAPISLMSSVPYAVFTHPSLPVRTVADLLRLAKAQPGRLSYGSAGHATGTHLAAEYFSSTVGISLTHVPYKGAAPAIADMLGGQVPLVFVTASSGQPHVASGKARALVITARQRSPVMRDVPTLAEAGYPGFEALSWLGLAARSGTPPAIVRRLHEEAVRALNTADVRTSIESQGNTVVTSTPEAFARFIGDETRKWKQVIASARIRID
jgi:tripartite-type tricarboxylate transporter receptor subunit TctC